MNNGFIFLFSVKAELKDQVTNMNWPIKIGLDRISKIKNKKSKLKQK